MRLVCLAEEVGGTNAVEHAPPTSNRSLPMFRNGITPVHDWSICSRACQRPSRWCQDHPGIRPSQRRCPSGNADFVFHGDTRTRDASHPSKDAFRPVRAMDTLAFIQLRFENPATLQNRRQSDRTCQYSSFMVVHSQENIQAYLSVPWRDRQDGCTPQRGQKSMIKNDSRKRTKE